MNVLFQERKLRGEWVGAHFISSFVDGLGPVTPEQLAAKNYRDLFAPNSGKITRDEVVAVLETLGLRMNGYKPEFRNRKGHICPTCKRPYE